MERRRKPKKYFDSTYNNVHNYAVKTNFTSIMPFIARIDQKKIEESGLESILNMYTYIYFIF